MRDAAECAIRDLKKCRDSGPLTKSEIPVLKQSEIRVLKQTLGDALLPPVWVSAKWSRVGLVFKAHRWMFNSTLASRVIKKKKKYLGFKQMIRFSKCNERQQAPCRTGAVQGYLAHKKHPPP